MPVVPPAVALLEPRLAAMARHLPEALDGSVQSVHQARVASRRLREVLPVVGPPAGRRRLGEASRRVRAVTRTLGPVRELDVTLQLLAEFDTASGPLEHGVRLVRRMVHRERARRREVMLETLTQRAVERTVSAVERVLARLVHATGDTTWQRSLRFRAIERSQALRKAVEDVGLLFDPARLHQVRIAAKKLRYVLEVVGEARLAPSGRLVRSLKDTQEHLGHLHDLQVLLVFVRSPEVETGSRNRKAIAALRDVVERECHREHARYLRRRSRVSVVCDAAVDVMARAPRS